MDINFQICELREYLPDTFDMLLVVSQNRCIELEETGYMCMGMPFKAFELIENVNFMLDNLLRKKKKRKEQPKTRSEDEIAVIAHAKLILMRQQNFSEEEAHRYLQKKSMDSGQSLVLTARDILEKI